jgi:hypothetical protein
LRHAGLVLRRGIDRSSGALRKDDQLTAATGRRRAG